MIYNIYVVIKLKERTFGLITLFLNSMGYLKMKKKTIGILLIISLVMIMSISAISAADTNDTSLKKVSDTNIAATSVAVVQKDNATSLVSEKSNDVEINVDDSRNENHKVDSVSSASKEVLSASNDDLLKHSDKNFLYGGEWYYDLEDAWSAAENNNGGTIKVWTGYYKYTEDDDDFEYTVNTAVSITLEPYGNGPVFFDGGESGWFLRVTNNNVKVTINDINFRNMKARDGGAIEVEDGAQLTLNRCIFESNYASSDGVSYGLGGAIDVDEGSLIANDCKFINNKADRYGGAICIEDKGSVTLNNCYFEGNKKGSDEANDFDDYSIDSGESADWSFNNCLFIGSGSLDIEVDAPTKSVTITPNVDDDIDKIVLYKNGVEYDDEACNNLRPVTFSHLEKGTYTVYLMKGDGKRYEYSGTTFTIIEPNFILNDDQVFETLSAAVNAISSGGSGVITVEGETYTESANFNVQINNKIVTIRPKSDDSVTFSGNSYSNFLIIGSGSKLTLEEITITGKFSDSALKFNANSEGEISDCEFKDIKNSQNQPGNPINAQNSNLVFNGTTFESNGPTLFKSTIVKIDDCTFTSNSGTKGGAINADSSTDLTVTNSEFTSNEASEEGGAIYASNLKLQDSEFTLNSAELGGAVYITNLANNLVNITECVFDDNLATNYRNIYSQSPERKFNLQYNEYDLYLKIYLKDSAYGSEYILDGVFDWGSNLNNTYTLLTGVADEQEVFGDLLTVVDNKFNINLGIIPGGTHEFVMGGMYTQGDSHDHFYGGDYYNDLNGNEFYLNDTAYAKIGIEKGNISLTLDVKDVLIPETPVLNVYANWDLNYTIFIGSNYYQVQVVNGKASIQLTGLDLGNYTVVAMRDADENFNLAMNFTTFSISKTYSNFLVLSTNVEYDTLAEAVANSNSEDMIYIKKGTYQDTGIVISNKTLDIIALEGAVFDAQGGDANFIIVKESAEVYMEGIAFTGLHNRNTNYGAIVNYGDLTLDSCNFTDNRITKTSFAENGGAAIFNNGHSLDIENCNFINNVAPLKVSTAAVTSWGFEDVSIVSSKFINNTARQGGAVYFGNISQFEPAIVSCDFEQNTAVKGSAIYVGNNSRYLSVALSNFKKNDIKNNFGENTQLEGGVIYVNAGNTEVTFDIGSSNFENNSNGNVDGGVICLDGISKAVIGSCIFNNNRGKLGSAILIKNPYNKKLFLVIDDSEFTNNNATTGAIATSSKVTTFIDECIFTNNTGENRHIYSNGFTVVHDSILDVKNAKLSALSVQYGENSIISGTADIGTNLYAEANLTVANENVTLEIKNNAFTYNAGILNRGKYYAVLNNIADSNNNTYLVDSISEIFRVTNVGFDLVVSVDNITYGETLKVVERLPANVTGALDYQLNGKYYTKDEIESLKLDAGKYTLVATYNHEDYTFTSTTVNFEVYKANPTISVADVEADYNESFIVNIETNVPSVYIIEIGEYKNAVYVNGSRSVEIKNVFEPGNYTIKVTSRERVNYISNFTEAILKVNGPSLANSLSNGQSSMDDNVTVENGNNKVNLNRKNLRNTLLLGEEEEGGKFIYQTDEDSDYEYCDSLDEAIAKVELWGEGIITVRGGTYSVSSIDIEGEIEFTIQAYEDEEVIFDCGGDDYFMLLTYDTEMEWVQTPPPPHPEFEQTDGPTVTLQNITVINGVATYGGAIDLEAGSLTLINCNFYNNHATSQGGAIYIGKWDAENDATLIAVNTTFINNYAEGEGGAIYIASDNLDGQSTSASFLLCSFLDNYQGEDDEREMNYFAGGNADEITCSYCVFSGKGEVYNFAIDKINQTVYVKGTSVDPFDSVVLLYSDQIPLYTINNNGSRDFNVTFEEVMAGNYTVGLMNDHNFNSYVFGIKFEMRVPNFILSADEVYENLTDAIDAVAENGIIYANVNYYDEDNMEIDIRKSFTLKNFKADGVTFDGGSQKWFFTIAEGYNVVFDGITFTDGAIKTFATIENYGNLVIKNCSFEGFETSTIIQNFGLLNILNSEFTLNLVDNTLVWNNRDLVIDTVEFSSNIVNKSSAVYNNGVADIVSSNFTENYNGGNGGAIYNKNSLSINSTSFNENEAVNGGAVYNEGSLEVLNSTFEDNTAKGYGGAIFNGRQANVYNSTFTGGYSEKDGGAIYNNYTMTVNNSTLIANSANGNGGAIYNNKSFEITKSIFGINFADEFANIYNAGDIQYSENTFDFYDVILIIPDGQYGIPTIITGTLNPEFNMDLQVTLPGFVDHKDATVTINEGVFEYNTGVLPKGTYDVRLEEVLYDSYGNIYYGEEIYDRLFVRKANVYINLTVDDVVLPGTPVLKINISKDGPIHLLFNNKFSVVNITNGQATLTLDTVGEGNYSVWVVREGDENYNDAANATTFTVSEYEGNFIVNSSGYQYDTLREALSNSLDDDIIYARAGVYSGADNIGLTISNKKLKIISLGDVVFDANSTDLSFITVDENADVNIYGVAIRGFNSKDKIAVINNKGNLTVDECIVINNTISEGNCPIIYNNGNLTVVGTEFNGNVLSSSIISSESNLIINGSSFENNTINFSFVISITNANSTKIVSSSFDKNSLKGSIIYAVNSEDIYINSIFFNNTQEGNAIYACNNNNLIVDNSSFTSNIFDYVIVAYENTQNTISGSIFLNNTARNVVYSTDKNLSVFESTFSLNTLSDYGALFIASKMNASVNCSVFTNNNANKYRNIYSVCDLNITNSVFDALNVDFTVYDINYRQLETIEGTIDIGTNLNFTVNLDIDYNSYSVNVTDNKFTYTSGILNGGDYEVVLNEKDVNSNTYIFDKITKIFTVNRIDPELNVTIADITQGEKLKVNVTISKNARANVVYGLNGNLYNKDQLENLSLIHGNYLVTAMYRGDKNHLPVTLMVGFEVHKIAPNIIVNDLAVNYTDKININVTVDVPDYYTVFLGNESISLYVEDSAIFTFASENFKPDIYEITVYVFETDDYAEAYAYANLTVNKAVGVFNLSNDVIEFGENATVSVKIPINASGNITYYVYDEDKKLVYNITQSCFEVLVVPNLNAGKYNVTGTYEGDSYYTNESIINYGTIFVNTQGVDLNLTVSNITYEENATVTIESNIDGDYLVQVDNRQFVVTVINGTGNVSVPNLYAGIYVVNVTIVDGNYSAYNETEFEVAPKVVSVVISVEDIIYGEDAVVLVYGEVDGEYIVMVNNQTYTVNVIDGKGNTTISGLFVNENILANVTIADGNYSANNNTTFNVIPKEIPVVISIGNITYGENTVVIVEADLDGDYIVTIRDVNYTIAVNSGIGVKFIPNLAAGQNILASVSIVDGNYSADNTTVFNINPKAASVVVSVGNITYGEDTVVVVESDVAGDYLVTIRDVNYTVTVTGGDGVIFIPNLAVGDQIVATVKREDNYTAFNETTFNIYQRVSNVEVAVVDITWNESAIVNVVAEVDGIYTLTVNDVDYSVEVINGSASQVISGLAAGNYTVQIAIVDGNYSASNKTEFKVLPKSISLVVSVENITYGENAVVIVESDVDGDYLVYIGNDYITITITNGTGNVSVSDLTVGSYDVNVTVVDGNYSGVNYTSFAVAVKDINVSVAVEDITYGEQAVVIVESDVDGDYLVYVGNDHFTVTVVNGTGNVSVSDLTVGSYDVNVTVVDGNYSGVNYTSFAVAVKDINVSVAVEEITYGEQAVVNVVSDVDGEYLVYVDGTPYIVSVVDGVGSIVVDGLTAGSHVANVTVVDGNYSGVNTTSFDVLVKQINVSVSVEDIAYGEQAVINVVSDVDGDYLVLVDGTPYTVTVVDGVGSVSVGNLTVGSHEVNVTVVDGNYSGVNTTSFEITVKDINVTVSVGNITYGEDTVVVVQSDVAGDYIVTIRGVDYTVSVNGGDGVVFIPNLAVGDQIAVTVKREDSYVAYNETAFNIYPRPVNVEVTVDDITWSESAVVNVVAEIDGMYTLTVNDANYSIEVVDGKASQVVSGLAAGTYVVQIATEGNYSSYNITAFNVEPKSVSLDITVEDIDYGDSAVVIVLSDVDGEYLVYVDDIPYTVDVVDGIGSVSVDDLAVGSYIAEVSVIDGNYSGSDFTSFAVAVKQIDVFVSVEDIIDGEKAVIIVEADVDGQYLVYVDDTPYTVKVADGIGSISVGGLDVGSHNVNVTVTDDSYLGNDSTSFTVAIKEITVIVDGKEYIVPLINGTAKVDIDNITVVVNGEEYNVPLENGTAKVDMDNITVVINGKEYNVPFVNGTPTINMDNLTVVVDGKEYVVPVVNGTGRLSSSKFEGLTVSDGLITGALVDDLGNPISNAVITYKVNGVESTIATDDKGLFALNVSDIANIEITYPGNSTALPATISFTFEQKIRQSTVIVGNNFTQYTVDYDAGERGQNFTTQLLDGNGNPIANKTVYIGYNGKTLERVTNATGHASVQINLRDKNRLTFAVAFLGDDDYNATMSVYLITLNKKPMTITASAKTYKASATKKYTVTLKTIKGDSADGKTYLKAGKKVTLKVNGKTYTAKTNSKGQATFTLKLTKKGTYSASIKYAGDNTYNSASKTAKITIK